MITGVTPAPQHGAGTRPTDDGDVPARDDARPRRARPAACEISPAPHHAGDHRTPQWRARRPAPRESRGEFRTMKYAVTRDVPELSNAHIDSDPPGAI